MPGDTPRQLLIEGLSDAAGFVGGALAGYGLGGLLGLDIFAQGYGASSLLGIALVGAGGGLGLHGARRWRASRRPPGAS
ncbi:hypothetical protein [Paracidovorax avenae]|uniref:hypothetical protein n=1 Tax=Paracidovorax avenae TaxID=80867 RepID=UPI000D17552E|nr:hypothetical protein [Paracidovorax avenae]AVS85927.1 hypothetical protein C8239_15155 [Paracidovorax avenae]AVS89603.1 hypothetical protein C8238_16315 [Paracidovorax avenae]AVS96665.1 hypothetical protein C8232_10695 [Paracidovorax avenae]AVT03778.1 hypothetical protein C8243_15695 [Paracidovorax avenae]AVT10677.1 hypothetical protein C8242_15185 [Paracidovorax avenae]